MVKGREKFSSIIKKKLSGLMNLQEELNILLVIFFDGEPVFAQCFFNLICQKINNLAFHRNSYPFHINISMIYPQLWSISTGLPSNTRKRINRSPPMTYAERHHCSHQERTVNMK
jgi:hypothetical protein